LNLHADFLADLERKPVIIDLAGRDRLPATLFRAGIAGAVRGESVRRFGVRLEAIDLEGDRVRLTAGVLNFN